jgi:hypothetical protein
MIRTNQSVVGSDLLTRQTNSKRHTAVNRVGPANNAYTIDTLTSLVNTFHFVGGLQCLVSRKFSNRSYEWITLGISMAEFTNHKAIISLCITQRVILVHEYSTQRKKCDLSKKI